MVVKLPPMCDHAQEISYLLRQGRWHDATAKAVAVLRAGNASALVQALVADMLQPPAKGRGRPRALPRNWYEIGHAFEELRDAGVTHEVARTVVAGRFGASESSVEKTVRMYRAGVKVAHED
jgi:hypothetical protein